MPAKEDDSEQATLHAAGGPSPAVGWRRTLAVSLAGSVLLWLAQPPAMLSLLAWVAPAPWLWLVGERERFSRAAYAALWLSGSLYWAAAVYWITLPHPYTPLGLPFLAGYLGLYLPAFVWLCRVAIRQLGSPLWLACPVVWVGLEWVQTHLFTGFLMGGLAHTQAWWPRVIQIAAFGGAYLVSLVMMMFAAGVADGVRQWRQSRDRSTVALNPRPPAGFFAAAIPVAVTLFVGHTGLDWTSFRPDFGQRATVALLQSDIRATWDPAPDRSRKIMDRFVGLSKRAVTKASENNQSLDLIVWPESMFRVPVYTFEGEFAPPVELDDVASTNVAAAEQVTRTFAIITGTPTLLGVDQVDHLGPLDGDPTGWKATFHNSAAMVDATGEFTAVYGKMHRVPFGEYIPLLEDWPAMGFLSDIPVGLKPGPGPVAMNVEGLGARGQGPGRDVRNERRAPNGERRLTLSPNICYETVIPHVIRRQVNTLRKAGTPPDLLVNLTNNAWFWGSSELEQHLACNIFRAVENGTPLVVSANGGLTAAIDSRGRVLAVSQRMREEVVIVEVPLDAYETVYTRWGEIVGLPCLIVCLWLAIIGVLRIGRG